MATRSETFDGFKTCQELQGRQSRSRWRGLPRASQKQGERHAAAQGTHRPGPLPSAGTAALANLLACTMGSRGQAWYYFILEPMQKGKKNNINK